MQCLEAAEATEAAVPILAGTGGFLGFFFRLSFSVFAWPLSSHCPFSRLKLEAVEAEEAIKLFSICCEEEEELASKRLLPSSSPLT